MKYLSQFLYVITAKRAELLLLVFLFLTISVLDALGIGLIGPFIGLAMKPELIDSNSFLSAFYNASGIKRPNQFIALIGLIVIIIFYLKSFFYYQIQSYVFKFCYAQKVQLRLRLMRTYLALPYTYYLKTNSANILQNIGGETAVFTYSIAVPLLNSIASFFVLFALLLLLVKADLLVTVNIFGLLLFAIISFHTAHRVSMWGEERIESNIETKLIGYEKFLEASYFSNK